MTFLSSEFGSANERLSAARECGIGSCVFGSDACYRQPLHREPGDKTFNGGVPSGKGTSDGWEDLGSVICAGEDSFSSRTKGKQL